MKNKSRKERKVRKKQTTKSIMTKATLFALVLTCDNKIRTDTASGLSVRYGTFVQYRQSGTGERNGLGDF